MDDVSEFRLEVEAWAAWPKECGAQAAASGAQVRCAGIVVCLSVSRSTDPFGASHEPMLLKPCSVAERRVVSTCGVQPLIRSSSITRESKSNCRCCKRTSLIRNLSAHPFGDAFR